MRIRTVLITTLISASLAPSFATGDVSNTVSAIVENEETARGIGRLTWMYDLCSHVFRFAPDIEAFLELSFSNRDEFEAGLTQSENEAFYDGFYEMVDHYRNAKTLEELEDPKRTTCLVVKEMYAPNL